MLQDSKRYLTHPTSQVQPQPLADPGGVQGVQTPLEKNVKGFNPKYKKNTDSIN